MFDKKTHHKAWPTEAEAKKIRAEREARQAARVALKKNQPPKLPRT